MKIDDNGDRYIDVKNISLMSPKVITAILQDYSKLKQDTYGCFENDLWYLLEDFDIISGQALESNPVLLAIVEMKIDGKTNEEIHIELQRQYDKNYSPEYISSLWRKKIPKVIADAAKEKYFIWYYNTKKLTRKKCSRCGQNKPMNLVFFSKNKGSKDGFYSICKACRRKKRK